MPSPYTNGFHALSPTTKKGIVNQCPALDMSDKGNSNSSSGVQKGTATQQPVFGFSMTGKEAKQLSSSGQAAKDARKNTASQPRPPTPPRKQSSGGT
ncbi:hypothetical protein VCV18_001503 [Metarhizium anisopliae]